MKPSVLIIALLFFSEMLFSQSGDAIYLWPNQVPGEFEEKHEPVQLDDTSGNVIRLSNITNPALLVFEPKKLNNLGVGVIICPGGAYQRLSINKEGYEVAEWLNELGYTAFVLQYRVPDRREGALMDIQRAIRIVRRNSDKYHLNSEIGVLGFSAGGSLCARVSTRFSEDLYTNVDAIDSLSCRPDFSMLIYPAYLDEGDNYSITPELTITDNTPPFFIFGTADDTYGNSSIIMTKALRDKNISVELHLLPTGGHGYGLRSGNIAAETWPSLVENWLEKMIKTD